MAYIIIAQQIFRAIKKNLVNLERMIIDLNPFKVIPKSEVKNFIDINGINIGKITKLNKENLSLIIGEWIKRMDVFLEKTKNNHQLNSELLSQRFISYDEYLHLFSSIDKEDYTYFPAFKYFKIKDKTELLIFISNKESTFEGYRKVFINEMQKGELSGLNFFLKEIEANINNEKLNTHAYLVGKTGSGKSELLKVLLSRLTEKTDNCLIFIDPHGDVAKQFSEIVHKKSPQRLVYFDPFLHIKEERFPVLNPLFAKGKNLQEIDLLAKNLTAVFQELLPNELSTNMKAVLEPCISVLLHREGSSLVDLQRLVKGDKELLAEVKSNAKHHKLFFDNFNDSSYTQTKSAIFTKIQSLLNSRIFYNCVTGNNTIDLEALIKDKKVIVCNLNKGLFGEEHAQAFGKLLIAQIKNFAFKQAEHERKQIYLAVDECHNFISNSMETILTEARKYKLSLILSNQMSKQLGSIEETTLSNVGAFFVGNSNSKDTLQKISGVTDIPFQNLKSTPKYHFWFSNDDTSFQFKVSDEFLNSLNNFEEIQNNSEFNYNKLKKVLLNENDKPKFNL